MHLKNENLFMIFQCKHIFYRNAILINFPQLSQHELLFFVAYKVDMVSVLLVNFIHLILEKRHYSAQVPKSFF